ncbi:MAG: helix-turn-helix domain-containing protein [Eubacterium sp.]|nr:helix-turn-helix domain-containing protein [Eubacterium sp.]
MKNELHERLRTNFTSRQYMIADEFEIYYYSDESFTPSNNHSHTYYELYFFINGDIDFLIGNNSYHLIPGDMVIIPPGIKHHAVARENSNRYQRIVFWVQESFYERLVSESTDYEYAFKKAAKDNIYIYHNFSSIEEKLFDLVQENTGERYGSASRIKIVIDDLILSINRIIYERDNQLKSVRNNDIYSSILTYINTHLTEPILIDDLAREFYISKAHISHTFKKNSGISVHQYITKKRLALFREALIENGEITPTYLHCGFNDYSSFYRAFKNEYGISPNEYKIELLRHKPTKKTE